MKKSTRIISNILGAAFIAGAGVGVGSAINKTPKTVTQEVGVSTYYSDLLFEIAKKTNYIADSIEKIEVEDNKLTIVTSATDNKNRTTSIYYETKLSTDQFDAVNKTVLVAYEENSENSYADYICTITDIVKTSTAVSVGVYKQANTETLEAYTSTNIYSLMNAYYLKNNDKANSVKISDNFNKHSESEDTTAELQFVTGNNSCEVSATVGDIEMVLNFKVADNLTFAEVKDFVIDCFENHKVSEILSVEYSYNQHEKVLNGINSIFENAEEKNNSNDDCSSVTI